MHSDTLAPSQPPRRLKAGLLTCLAGLLLCLCATAALGGMGALGLVVASRTAAARANPSAAFVPSHTPASTLLPTPTPTPTLDFTPTLTPTSIATPTPTSTPQPQDAFDTLKAIEQAIVPASDLRQLSKRLGKIGHDAPLTLEPPASPLRLGDQQTFWVGNTDTDRNFTVEATLRYITDHVYFWVENGVSYNPKHLEALTLTFENEIYPTNRAFFGSEWTPGIDGDEHLYILYAKGLGLTTAAYFSSADEYPPAIHEYSNAHEMFVINASNTPLNDRFTYAVLAHEFQHMIHWYGDRNESTWLNEGFADLAAFLNGYEIGGHDEAYVENTDIQLTDWPTDGDTIANYGAAFLFTTYFLDRFGEDATRALVADQENGMHSVDGVLAQIGATDPLSGQPVRADDLFLDWALTNFLLDDTIADGRFAYHNYPNAPQANETERVHTCPLGPVPRQVNQYGVDYVLFDCPGTYTLHFEGQQQVKLLDTNPSSGRYAFWSNRGDDSDMTLTRQFDFTAHSGALTLSYMTWYDIEEDYDYLYLEYSLDGETWEILHTPSCTTFDPNGNSFGCGYTGLSGDDKDAPQWIEQSVDLSNLAGKNVWLRFEYLTDAAVNGEGLLLDDISIPQIGYAEDFESGDGGWEAAGFVRIANNLRQTFRLALITETRSATTVTYLPLTPDNIADVAVTIGGEVRKVILVITGVTRYTRQPALYQYEVR